MIVGVGHKKGLMGSDNAKKGVNHTEVLYHLQVWECHSPPPTIQHADIIVCWFIYSKVLLYSLTNPENPAIISLADQRGISLAPSRPACCFCWLLACLRPISSVAVLLRSSLSWYVLHTGYQHFINRVSTKLRLCQSCSVFADTVSNLLLKLFLRG